MYLIIFFNWLCRNCKFYRNPFDLDQTLRSLVARHSECWQLEMIYSELLTRRSLFGHRLVFDIRYMYCKKSDIVAFTLVFETISALFSVKFCSYVNVRKEI